MTDFYEHPYYRERSPFFRLYRDLYEGVHATLISPTYLFLHELEDGDTEAAKKLRRIRAQRTRYTNMMEPLVSRYVSLFFKEEPELDDATKSLFGDGITDVTGTGKSFSNFIKEDIAINSILYGRPIVLTDTYGDEFKSLAEQQAAGARPFFEIIHPLDLKDWELDKYGGFKFARWEYTIIDPRTGANEPPKRGVYSRVLEKVPGGYTSARYKAKEKRQTDNQGMGSADTQQRLGQEQREFCSDYEWEIVGSPKVFQGESLPLRSIECQESWVKDTAQQILKLYNLESTRDSCHYYQAHRHTFIIGDVQKEAKKALAEYTINFLPANSNVIAIEPVNTASIDENINRTKATIYQIAFNQNRTVSADSKQVESADTQNEGKEQLVTLIKAEIEALENLTNKIIEDYAVAAGKTPGKVTFCKDITVDDVREQINTYMQLRGDIARYPTWQKQSLIKIAQGMNLPEEETIIQEIQAAEPEPTPEERAAREGDALGAVFGG